MRVAIGVATFNRGDLVSMSARSLSRSRLSPDTDIVVADDASTEFDVEFLKELYPAGTDIQRRENNSGGADYALCDLLNRLVTTGADALVLLDSDMIVAADFAEKIVELLPLTNGILCLFNTAAHPAFGARGPLILKKTVGSAGTVWPRDLAQKMLDAVPPGPRWDWRFCDYLMDSGYEICVVRNSLAQHIGINGGQNTSSPLSGDFGAGFSDVDAQSAYVLIEQIGFGAQSAVRLFRSETQSVFSTLDAIAQRLKAVQGAQEAHYSVLQSLSEAQEGHDRVLQSLSEAREGHDRVLKSLSEAREGHDRVLKSLSEAREGHDKVLQSLSDQLSAQAFETAQLKSESRLLIEQHARTLYLLRRGIVKSLLFRSDGRPVKLVRWLLFRNSCEPRAPFRVLVLKKNGQPRKAFAYWLHSRRAGLPAVGVSDAETVNPGSDPWAMTGRRSASSVGSRDVIQAEAGPRGRTAGKEQGRILLVVQGLFFISDSIGFDCVHQYRALRQMAGRESEVRLFAERFDGARYPDVRIEPIERLYAEFETLADAILIYHFCDGWEELEEKLPQFPGRIVVRWHNNTPPWFFGRSSPEWARRCVRGFEQIRWLERSAQAEFWCNSAYTLRQLEVLGLRGGRSSIVYPASRYLDASIDELVAKSPEAIGFDPIEVLFVGRVVEHKGHRSVIVTCAHLQRELGRRVKAVFPGRGGLEGVYAGELKRLADALAVEIDLPGEVDHAALDAMYARANVLLCLTEHEGFGLPVYEAMRLNVPVVGWANTAVAEALEGHPLAVREHDIRKFAGAVSAALDPEIRQYVVQWQRENVLPRYTEAVVAEQLASALKGVDPSRRSRLSAGTSERGEIDAAVVAQISEHIRRFVNVEVINDSILGEIPIEIPQNFVTVYDLELYEASRLAGANVGPDSVSAMIAYMGNRSAQKTERQSRRSGGRPWCSLRRLLNGKRAPAGYEVIRDSLFFDEAYYLQANPDVLSSGHDPALHYLLHGGREGRNPSPLFSTREYLDRNPDVRVAQLNPLVHYETKGRSENRQFPLPRSAG